MQDDVRERRRARRRAGCTTPSTRRTSSSATRGRRGRLAVLRQLPQGRLLHRLPRRPRALRTTSTRATTSTCTRSRRGWRRRSARAATAEQSFCLDCHLRLGVTMSEPAGRAGERALPPAEGDLERPAAQARAPLVRGRAEPEPVRELPHRARLRRVPRRARGSAAGSIPHQTGFVGGCATQFRRNPRPCFVCHEPGDGELAQCR